MPNESISILNVTLPRKIIQNNHFLFSLLGAFLKLNVIFNTYHIN